jgi:hypothetical protein
MQPFVLAVMVLLTAIAVFEPSGSFAQSQPNPQNQPGQGAHTPVWKKRYYKSRAKDGTEKWVQRGSATDLALQTRDPADPVPDSWAPPIIIGPSGSPVGALCGARGEGRMDDLNRCMGSGGMEIPKY